MVCMGSAISGQNIYCETKGNRITEIVFDSECFVEYSIWISNCFGRFCKLFGPHVSDGKDIITVSWIHLYLAVQSTGMASFNINRYGDYLY